MGIGIHWGYDLDFDPWQNDFPYEIVGWPPCQAEAAQPMPDSAPLAALVPSEVQSAAQAGFSGGTHKGRPSILFLTILHTFHKFDTFHQLDTFHPFPGVNQNELFHSCSRSRSDWVQR